MGKIIGIDLGTTNSCVSVVENGRAYVIENSEGDYTTPSIVAFRKNKDPQWLVGAEAKQQAVINPKNTLYAVKRLIGRSYDEVTEKERELLYSIVKGGESGGAWVEVEGEKMAPQEVSAKVLQKMRRTAEEYLGEKVTEAVITVPAYFDDAQRKATMDAGRIAGLDVKEIINEPTAAALAYGMNKDGSEQKIAVFDLGGGTFDISIISIFNADGQREFEVLSTNGNNLLGGEDFDNKIINHLIEMFEKETGVNLHQVENPEEAMQSLKEAAEKAKCRLSTSNKTEISVQHIGGANKHLSLSLTRETLEGLVKDLIDECEEPCRKALKDAEDKGMLIDGKVDAVVLVGGMTRMPAVQEKAKAIFGVELRKNINPDEAVAMGAALEAGVLQGDIHGMRLLDVTPHSLGTEIIGDKMVTIIERNTTIPVTRTKDFCTAYDQQTEVLVTVYKGEEEVASKNKRLGQVTLDEIDPAPAGDAQIDVTFKLDRNGRLTASAKNMKTGKEVRTTIEIKSELSEDEVKEMEIKAQESEESE